MRHSLPASCAQFPATANSSSNRQTQLDRLYQRIADDLDQLLNAVGLKLAA